MATSRSWVATAMSMGREVAEGTRESRGGLSPNQARAVDRGALMVERMGGVLLADAVGLGKTRVAVAMARQVVRRARRRGALASVVLFAVPARLRENWRRAINASGWQVGRDARIVSHHWLSRHAPECRPALVVVDEAHRFRNPAARRSQHLASVTARAPSILVTATPVCTSRSDLRVLLSYFLTDGVVKSLVGMGLEAAFAADEAGEFDLVEILEEVVIRRREPDFGVGTRPDVVFEILSYEAGAEERWIWKYLEARLQRLTLTAAGPQWPRGLVINNLLRSWESGPEALWRRLDDLAHLNERWLQAHHHGRSLDGARFREVFTAVDRRQGVFSFASGAAMTVGTGDDVKAVRADLDVLDDLQRRVNALRGGRAALLQRVARYIEEADSKVLVFATYRACAEEFFNYLAGQRQQVGLITGGGARATGLGRCADAEVLRRFLGDPREIADHQQLRVLVATDCLAEGVNLQRCRRMILADLPYSPLKLEQRVGRIARPGGGHRRVEVMLPRPECWTDSLGMRRRLSTRIDAARSLGVGPGLAAAILDVAGEDHRSSPLAAMTEQDRLWLQLASDATDESPKMMRARGIDGDELWVRVRVEARGVRYFWLWVRPNRAVVARLSDQLPGLVKLADTDRAAQAWAPQGRLWQQARRWMERYAHRLKAARLAPPLLGEGSAAVRLWRLLRRGLSDRELGDAPMSPGQMDRWRRRLLRAHPPGISTELEALLQRDPSAEQVIRHVRKMPDEAPPQRIVVEAAAALRLEGVTDTA